MAKNSYFSESTLADIFFYAVAGIVLTLVYGIDQYLKLLLGVVNFHCARKLILDLHLISINKKAVTKRDTYPVYTATFYLLVIVATMIFAGVMFYVVAIIFGVIVSVATLWLRKL
ncbi:MAG: hypothetical protein EOO00_11730 [Chitinophagaceae bacterium]|nr:MAG: hypothetical protein EOO00_11730 [Chitinophagaceae bacterium]